jgi:farnesyl diphosphate synthase
MIAVLAEAAGTRGMAGGQAVDLAATGRQLDLPALQEMHARKTGALIRASVALGAMTADAGSEPRARLDEFARHLGLAFQIVDDVLDVEGDTATLGKPQGSDQESAKATYPALLGLEHAKALAREHQGAALESLRPMGDNAQLLRELAGFVIHRSH